MAKTKRSHPPCRFTARGRFENTGWPDRDLRLALRFSELTFGRSIRRCLEPMWPIASVRSPCTGEIRSCRFGDEHIGKSRIMTPLAPLRILHVLEATLGGTRRYLDDLHVATRELPMLQGLVYGTSRSDSGFSEVVSALAGSGWYLRAASDMRRAVNPLRDLRSTAVIRRAIADFAPTIVHAHSAKGGALARLATRTLGAKAPPVVYSPHALPSRLGPAYMLAERVLAGSTKRFIAVSDSERTEIIGEGVCEPDRVDVVYPRIDAEYFAPRDKADARRALALGSSPIVVGIGRLAPQKDPLRFVETIAKVRAGRPEVSGIWVGDGELREAVEAAARRHGLGAGFHVTGWTADIRPYIAACDVLLSTSRYESFGYVIPETLAMGRPVVAARVMGVVDVLNVGHADMLFEPDATDQAALLLERIIDSEALQSELAAVGRRSVVERFSTHAMAAALVTSYQRARG